MIHITQACVDMLAAAVEECDRMLVDEEVRHDKERATKSGRFDDRIRLQHYVARRVAIRDHRKKLVALYTQITGKNPWASIPY